MGQLLEIFLNGCFSMTAAKIFTLEILGEAYFTFLTMMPVKDRRIFMDLFSVKSVRTQNEL